MESLLCDHNLTTVGTIRKNKREIPKKFLEIKKRPKCDRMFGFKEKLALVSYIPKSKSKKKNVVLISSMHQDKKIDEATGEDKKPEITTFYNSTKGGVDVVDMMMHKYSISRNSRRWPLTVFFALLNIFFVNSYVLYVHNPQNKLTRCKFIKKVSLVLSQDTREDSRTCICQRVSEQVFQECYPKLQLRHPQQAHSPHKLRQKDVNFVLGQRTKR